MGHSHGMNVAEIRTVALDLHNQASALGIARGRIDRLVEESQQHWSGMDSVQFVNEWQSEHRAAVLNLETALEELSQAASRNAEWQEATSNAYDGGSSGGTGMPAVFGGMIGKDPGLPFSPPGDFWGFFKIGLDGANLLHAFEVLGGINGLDLSANLDDVVTGSPLISTLLYAPEAFQAFSDAANGQLSPIDGLAFAGKTLDLGSTFLERFSGSFHGVATGQVFGAIGGAVQAASDWGKALEAYQSGDPWAGTYNAAHGLAAGVGGVFKPVQLGLMAWDTGVNIGTSIAQSPPAQAFQDDVVAYGAARDGDIGTRYDFGQRGTEALLNYAGDNIAVGTQNAANAVGGFFGSILK